MFNPSRGQTTGLYLQNVNLIKKSTPACNVSCSRQYDNQYTVYIMYTEKCHKHKCYFMMLFGVETMMVMLLVYTNIFWKPHFRVISVDFPSENVILYFHTRFSFFHSFCTLIPLIIVILHQKGVIRCNCSSNIFDWIWYFRGYNKLQGFLYRL